MPREIWSEGRVTGFSAYEIYVKQHISEDPNTPPATEREWLSSNLAMGNSMLLRVPTVEQGETEHTFVDIYLPSNTRLAAANTIVAQFFDGEGEFSLTNEDNPSGSDWAIRVTDYGQLISNTAESSPSGQVGSEDSIPVQALAEKGWTDDHKAKLKEYLRIYDGLVIQPGNWVDSENKPPEKDFQPNLKQVYPRVRLHVRGSITHHPLILLTGFTIKGVLIGTSGLDSSNDTESPQDGDFLGPAVFPWASKIVFVVPNSYITYFESGDYTRTIETPTAESTNRAKKLIKDTPVIDMQATDPETFYDNYNDAEDTSYRRLYSVEDDNPQYGYQVDAFSTLGDDDKDGEAVLTIYQKKSVYPPAMYGTFVNTTGELNLNPLDVVAPGTIKMFNQVDASVLNDYQNTFPGTTGMNKTSNGTVQILNSDGEIVDVANMYVDYLWNDTRDGEKRFIGGFTVLQGEDRPKVLRVQTGNKSSFAFLLSNISENLNTDPDPIPMFWDNSDLNPPVSTQGVDDDLTWSALMVALAQNAGVDILEDRLKDAKYTLRKSVVEASVDTIKRRTDMGSAYLEFGSAVPGDETLRLYISKVAPNTRGVPEGSIGIGWGIYS